MAPNLTSEAHTWSPRDGLKSGGFPCKGVVSPPQHITSPRDGVYDVIVIGGGYAGLSAARDLTHAGRHVLLVEGRDRVGGRTFTIEVDGHNFEMGGGWVYHSQPFTHRELTRYNMDSDLITTRDPNHECNYFSINVPGSQRNIPHEEATKMIARMWKLFIDVDGQEGRSICPLPFQQLGNVEVDPDIVKKWDSYSCYDRFMEIKDQLTQEEQGVFKAFILNITGGERDMKNSGLWDMIRSHALNGFSFDQMDAIWLSYKLRDGQSTLARHIFDDAVSTGLQYTFGTHVSRIVQASPDNKASVEIHTRDAKVFKGRKVICTAPLNTLGSISFEPQLSQLRQSAIREGHINFMGKCHAIVKGDGLAAWAGAAFPGNLDWAFGNGTTAHGDAVLCSFGHDERPGFIPERHPEKVAEAFRNFHPMDIKRTLWHNWNTDPYTQGGPCFMAPNFMTTYLDELQKRDGNIFFANADWARAWRNFIDGALEQGFINANDVLLELTQEDKAHRQSRI